MSADTAFEPACKDSVHQRETDPPHRSPPTAQRSLAVL